MLPLQLFWPLIHLAGTYLCSIVEADLRPQFRTETDRNIQFSTYLLLELIKKVSRLELKCNYGWVSYKSRATEVKTDADVVYRKLWSKEESMSVIGAMSHPISVNQ